MEGLSVNIFLSSQKIKVASQTRGPQAEDNIMKVWGKKQGVVEEVEVGSDDNVENIGVHVQAERQA